MLDCKVTPTPMALNLKLSCDDTSDLVDVPKKYETRHMICCEHTKLVLDVSETCSPGCYKACIEVPEGYS